MYIGVSIEVIFPGLRWHIEHRTNGSMHTYLDILLGSSHNAESSLHLLPWRRVVGAP